MVQSIRIGVKSKIGDYPKGPYFMLCLDRSLDEPH